MQAPQRRTPPLCLSPPTVWAVNGGSNPAPSTFDCSQYASTSTAYTNCEDALTTWYSNQALPAWSVLVVVPAAILAGWALFTFIEEPGRRLLRSRGKPGE